MDTVLNGGPQTSRRQPHRPNLDGRATAALPHRRPHWGWALAAAAGAAIVAAAVTASVVLMPVIRVVTPASVPAVPQVDTDAWSWKKFHGVRLPVSDHDGPRHQRNDLAWGYSATPAGALLAAVNTGVRANPEWGTNIFRYTIDRQVIGLDAATLLANCRASYEQAPTYSPALNGGPLGPVDATEAGFRWVSYIPDMAAAVDILTVPTFVSTRINLQWHKGDWRVIAPPGGDWGNSAIAVNSTTGFTLFPAP